MVARGPIDYVINISQRIKVLEISCIDVNESGGNNERCDPCQFCRSSTVYAIVVAKKIQMCSNPKVVGVVSCFSVFVGLAIQK